MLNKLYLSSAILCLTVIAATAFPPNPLISKLKPAFASFSGSVDKLVDGIFGPVGWEVPAAESWVAINVGEGPETVLLTWNTTNSNWADSLGSPGDCAQYKPVPKAYTIQTSSNSTNGDDGDWNDCIAITDNVVAARGHQVAFTGASWIKMVITDGERSKIDEIEVFDITHGDYDTWFFAGTSISQMTFKDLIQEKNFAHFINEWNSDYTPAFIRGGIGCITLAGMRNDIKKYIEYGGSVKHFCIEIGTNDAWGGSNSGAKNFGIRLQRVIDSCVYYGIQPIIARTLATNEAKAGWQVHEDYLTVIDSLTTANNLHPGPDFYGYFIDHPEELANDGVHPNTTGAGSIQRLWAECVEPLYAQTTIEKQRQGKLPDNTQPMIYALSTSGGIIRFSAMHEGIVSIFTVGGKEIVRKSCGIGLNTLRTLPHGCYILRYTGNNTATTIHPFIATDRS